MNKLHGTVIEFLIELSYKYKKYYKFRYINILINSKMQILYFIQDGKMIENNDYPRQTLEKKTKRISFPQ